MCEASIDADCATVDGCGRIEETFMIQKRVSDLKMRKSDAIVKGE